MMISRLVLVKGAIWTSGAFGFAQVLRLITSIALTRLLAPELFGIMQIVYSFRTGVELVSDVGIGQNIVFNRDANKPEFYNTVWSLQVIRGIVLCVIFSVVAVPVARIYSLPILSLVMPSIAVAFVISGFTSASPSLLQKRMRFGTITIFEGVVGVLSSAAQIALAYFSPTVWALVIGNLVTVTIHTIGSYFLLNDIRHRFFFI